MAWREAGADVLVIALPHILRHLVDGDEVAVEGSKQMIEKAFEEFQKRVYKVKLVGYAE